MDYIKLGSRIRDYRKRLNWTQEHLSEMAGISLSFLGHVERGTRKASLETIVAICNSLKVSPQYLLQDSLADDLIGMPAGNTKKHAQMLQEVSDIFNRYFTDGEE